MNDAVIDTCCLINLYATGDVRGILTCLGWEWHLARAAKTEALYVRTRDEHGDVVRTPIEVHSTVEEGIIHGVDVEDEEEVALYVRLAADLDDGEAMGLAIARHRGWTLATDDRKARRFAGELGVAVLTTPEIMREWACVAKLKPSEVAQALRNVEFGAHFVPARNTPGYEWWAACLESS